MKILAFTDMHGSGAAYRKIKTNANLHKPDVLACAGDITIFENKITFWLRKLNSIGKPVVIVHGNHEEPSSFNTNLRNIHFAHKKHFILNNTLFLGYGGGGFSDVDEEFRKTGEKFNDIIAKNKDKKIIFITHAPPYKTRLDNLNGEHCGNKTLRHFIDRNRIDLHVCGHLHENFGREDKIKHTRIVNPGPFGKMINL